MNKLQAAIDAQIARDKAAREATTTAKPFVSQFRFSQVHAKKTVVRIKRPQAKPNGIRSNWGTIVERGMSWKRRADAVAVSRKLNTVNYK